MPHARSRPRRLGLFVAAFLTVVPVGCTDRREAEPEAAGPHDPAARVHRNRVADSGPRGGSGAVPDDPREIEELLDREEYVRALGVLTAQLRARSRVLGLRHTATAASLHRIGTTLHLSGDQLAAEEALRLAVALRTELVGERDPRLAESLHALGLVARYVDDRDRSWELYQRALDILRANGRGESLLAGEILLAQASWLRRADFDRAIERYREAFALHEKLGPQATSALASNMTWLGWTLVRAGRPAEGAPYLDRAAKQLRSLGMGQHSQMATVVNLQADDLVMRGRWRDSEKLYEENVRLRQLAREKSLPGFPRRKSPLDGYDVLAWISLQKGDPERAWSLLQRSKSILSQDFLSLGRWRTLSPGDYRDVRALRQQYLGAKRELQQCLRACAPDDETWEAWLRKLEVRARLYALERNFLGDHPLAEPSAADVRARLGPATAYIGWLELQLGTDRWLTTGPTYATGWAYVLRPGEKVYWIPLWEARTMEEYQRIVHPVDTYIKLTLHAVDWKLRVGRDKKILDAAREIARTYFDPLLPHLQGVDTLVVERQDPVPIEALIGPDGRHLGDRFAVSYSPSAAAFLLLSERDASKRGPLQAALALGEPFREAPSHPPAQSGGAVRFFPCDRVEEADALPALPHSGEEAVRIASMFPSATLLRGREASEARLTQLSTTGELPRFGVIHIATHALIDMRPERCALALASPSSQDGGSTDGLVDAEEILYGWELDADMLSLSGCRTARGLGLNRGEFVGFTQVLLAAGARSVVSSLWDVDDRASAMLMQRFYQNLATPHGELGGRRPAAMSKAAALQDAKRWLREYTSPEGAQPFRHPIYWSGFILLGPPE